MHVYSLENCPHCDALKAHLYARGAEFVECDLNDAAARTDVIVGIGYVPLEAPVLYAAGKFYDSSVLFPGHYLNQELVDKVVNDDMC